MRLSHLIIATTLVLTACGGGGGGGGGSQSPNSLNISGTTSTGAALAGATVEARCSNGTTSTATSNSDGTFTVAVTGGVLPCMLRATGTDSSGNAITLHSIADVGTSTANVTPLTELVVAAATGANSSTPADAFGSFATNTTTQSGLSKEKLAYAKTVVASAVAAAGTAGGTTANLTNVDPINDSFKVGSDNDKIIDNLIAALKQNATQAKTAEVIASLSTQIQKATNDNPSDATAASNEAKAGSTGTVSSPFVISNCPAVTNTSYRIVGLGGSYGTVNSFNFSPSSMSGTASTNWSDGTTNTNTIAFDSVNPCKFKITPNGSYALTGAYAASGIFVVQDPGSTSTSQTPGVAIGFPAQKIELSELAGDWIALEYSKDGSNGWTNYTNQLTIDKSGNITNGKTCAGSLYATCASFASTNGPVAITSNTTGGFNVSDSTGATTDRFFAYRTPSGSYMFIASLSQGGLVIGTKQTVLMSHPVGYTSNGYYTTAYNGTAAASNVLTSFHSYTYEVTASDTNSITWLRTLFDNSLDNFTVTDTLNSPTSGFRSRPSVTYTRTGATTSTKTNAAIQITIPGGNFVVGISDGVSSSPFISLSVNH